MKDISSPPTLLFPIFGMNLSHGKKCRQSQKRRLRLASHFLAVSFSRFLVFSLLTLASLQETDRCFFLHCYVKTNMRLGNVTPEESALRQNYPNPFNPETWIPYQLPQGTDVTIRIYNVKGQLIRTLRLGQKPAGMYISKGQAAHWNGQDEHGDMVSSGVYFYSIDAGNFSATRKLVVAK